MMAWAVKDQVSPYKITLIVVIEEYCKYDFQCHQGERESLTETQERHMMLLLLSLVQSADIELKWLMEKLGEIATDDFIETVTQRLCSVCEDGVGALMDLMLSLEKNLFDGEENSLGQCVPLLERPSVLGLFIRRMILAFNKLTFSQVTKVQGQYILYIKNWKQNAQQAERSLLDTTGLDDVSMNVIGPSSGHVTWEDSFLQNESNIVQVPRLSEVVQRHSQRQAEYFIAQQTNLLGHNETEALAPKQLQEKITQVLRSNPHLAEAHFLSYMNNLRINEYCSAMESLYHYFDRQQVLSNPNQSQQNAGNKNKTTTEEEGLSRGFRYAALNLASLQYRFGHRNEALAAIQEAIRMAQESNDNVCLQHALSWLERLGVQQTSSTAYLLDRLVSKSTELNLPYLTSLGIQSFAKHNALATAKPASVFEFILKSDIVNCQHSLADLMCTSYAQKGALWNMYGNREMCMLSSQLMLHLNTSELGVYHNAEAECLALCHLATVHSKQGEYELCNEILSTAKSRFPPHTQFASLWMQCQQQLSFKRACYQGNWSVAEQAFLQLNSINTMEAKYCQCVLHKEKGEITRASQLISSLIKECKSTRKITHPQMYCRLLILQSELLCSTENTTDAIEPLLNCITVCVQHHYFHLATMAVLQLAFVQYLLGTPCQAMSLISAVLHSVLAHGSVYDQARAQYLMVRCHVSAAKQDTEEDRHKVLSSCVQVLSDVLTLFRQVEAGNRTKDVLYYQARIYNELGYVTERNKCALEFKQLDQLWPSWHATTVCIL